MAWPNVNLASWLGLSQVDKNMIEQCCAVTLFIQLSTCILNNIVQPKSGVIILNNIADNYEQCGQYTSGYNVLPCFKCSGIV